MMRRTIATTAAASRTATVAATWTRSLSSTSVALQAARKPRVGDIDVSKLDPTAGIDFKSPNEVDPNEGVSVRDALREHYRQRKGYPHPYDELDPDDELYNIKKAQFPY